MQQLKKHLKFLFFFNSSSFWHRGVCLSWYKSASLCGDEGALVIFNRRGGWKARFALQTCPLPRKALQDFSRRSPRQKEKPPRLGWFSFWWRRGARLIRASPNRPIARDTSHSKKPSCRSSRAISQGSRQSTGFGKKKTTPFGVVFLFGGACLTKVEPVIQNNHYLSFWFE